jgi:hypothetical protein
MGAVERNQAMRHAYVLHVYHTFGCMPWPSLGMWIPVFDGVGVVWWWFVNRIQRPLGDHSC